MLLLFAAAVIVFYVFSCDHGPPTGPPSNMNENILQAKDPPTDPGPVKLHLEALRSKLPVPLLPPPLIRLFAFIVTAAVYISAFNFPLIVVAIVLLVSLCLQSM